MAQGDIHIGVHDGPSDLGRFNVFSTHHRDLHIVGTLQAVADDDLAAGGEGRKAVFIGSVHMLQGMLAAAYVEGVTVGEEGHAPSLLDKISHHLGVVGPQKAQIPRLAEVDLDADKFLFKINTAHPRLFHQAVELVQLTGAYWNMKIGEINLRRGHADTPFIVDGLAAACKAFLLARFRIPSPYRR